MYNPNSSLGSTLDGSPPVQGTARAELVGYALVVHAVHASDGLVNGAEKLWVKISTNNGGLIMVQLWVSWWVNNG